MLRRVLQVKPPRVALARACSSEVAETEYKSSFSESEHLPHELQEPFRPSGEVAWAWKKFVKGDPARFNAYSGMCRKLALDDAMTQMRFARTDKGAVIYNLLASARHNAVNDFKMNPDYLIVDEIMTLKGPTHHRVYRGGKGKYHLRRVRHVHLAVKVKEAMPLYGQIGRWCGLLKLNKHGNFRVPFRQIDKVYWTKTFRQKRLTYHC